MSKSWFVFVAVLAAVFCAGQGPCGPPPTGDDPCVNQQECDIADFRTYPAHPGPCMDITCMLKLYNPGCLDVNQTVKVAAGDDGIVYLSGEADHNYTSEGSWFSWVIPGRPAGSSTGLEINWVDCKRNQIDLWPIIYWYDTYVPYDDDDPGNVGEGSLSPTSDYHDVPNVDCDSPQTVTICVQHQLPGEPRITIVKIDGVNVLDSPIYGGSTRCFSGYSAGNHTVYVRDSAGASDTIAKNVNAGETWTVKWGWL